MIFKENIKHLLFVFVIIMYLPVSAQNTLIKGKLLDANNENAPVIYGNVTLLETDQTVTTDYRGQYIFENLPAGAYTLEFSFLGYETCKKQFNLKENKIVSLNTYIKQSEAPILTNEKALSIEL